MNCKLGEYIFLNLLIKGKSNIDNGTYIKNDYSKTKNYNSKNNF